MAYNPLNPNGQATMANSQPVVIASNQTAVAVTAAQSTATNLKAQAEAYQGGTAVGSSNPLQVTLANTGANATPVTVSGTVTAAPATDVAPATQNITVVDSGSSSAAGANNQTIVIGTATAGSSASFALSSIETIRVEVTGIWTGTITAEQSLDGGTTWTSQGLHQGAYTTSSFIAGFIAGGNVAGATNFRMRATATITGTAVVKVIESINTQSVYIANAAPAGTIISVLNSTTATLTSGSVYTGTGEDVSNFSEMRISVFSNVASATDGLSIQQSSDNTNWDITDTYTIAAATAGQGKTFVVPRQARYYRVVYTNGGTNQTTFRLQSILNRTATAPSSNRATDAYTNETDLVQNQVFPMGYNGATWDRLRTVGTGVLSTSAVLTAGSAVIGHVIADSGSTTAVTQATAASLNATVVGTGTFATQSVVTQSTAANLNATVVGAGSAGTANAGVVTVQGIASMTKLLVTPDSVALPANQSVNMAQVAGTTTDTNSGNKSAGTLRVVLATDQPQLTNKLLVTPDANSAVNVAQINGVTPLMGNGTTGTGSQRVTIASDNTANSNPWLVTQSPATTGGLSIASGTIGNAATSIKGSAGQVYGWYIYNSNASVAYVQFYNVASGSVTPGTTGPTFSIGIPATSGANVHFNSGIAFGTAITIAITTTRSGGTSPGSTVDYNVFYK